MTCIQIVLLTGIAFISLYFFIRWKKRVLDILLLSFLIACAVVFVVWPDLTQNLAKFLGVGRGHPHGQQERLIGNRRSTDIVGVISHDVARTSERERCITPRCLIGATSGTGRILELVGPLDSGVV